MALYFVQSGMRMLFAGHTLAQQVVLGIRAMVPVGLSFLTGVTRQ